MALHDKYIKLAFTSYVDEDDLNLELEVELKPAGYVYGHAVEFEIKLADYADEHDVELEIASHEDEEDVEYWTDRIVSSLT